MVTWPQALWRQWADLFLSVPLAMFEKKRDNTTNQRSASGSLLPELSLHLHVSKIALLQTARRSGFSSGAHFFSRRRGPEGMLRKKELPACRTSSLSLPSRSQAPPGQLFRREEIWVLGHPAVRANSARPSCERARARRPGPQVSGKPGRGAGTGPAAPGRRRTLAVVVVALAT